MKPFQYARPDSVDDALRILQLHPEARLLGGGTNLVDLMREGIEQPDHLVDIQRLPLANIEKLSDGGVRIGATARNSEIANHALIREHYPLLSKALLSGASPQLRNMATAAGNLMQRTRCYYFMDPAFLACNKRQPGSGCAALDGVNRIHAIFGTSGACIAVHPSDMCVALAALDAVIRVSGPRGERSIPIDKFHRLPGDTPHVDTNLAANEIVLSIDLPPPPAAMRSEYLKVRDRQSFAFALVSCAATLEMKETTIQSARLVFGGVAHKPWRACQSERFLKGKEIDIDTFSRAADLAAQGAAPRDGNGYKVPLLKNVARRALCKAGGLP